MALDWCQNFVQYFVSAKYLEDKMIEFKKNVYGLILTRSRLGLLRSFFSHLYIVMALDLRQNFISTQYLANKKTEFHQILYMHSY